MNADTDCPELAGVQTLAELLQRRAAMSPASLAYVFLDNGEDELARWTCGELEVRARAVAAMLADAGLRGERALLLYPPGLEFIAAFLGCLYGGVIAVPSYPPTSRRMLPRLAAIVADAEPRVVLAPAASLDKLRVLAAAEPSLAVLDWRATDDLAPAPSWSPPVLSGDDVAFLQYTSGSTSAPKGVVVCHRNLVHNQEMIRRAFSNTASTVVVGWLPFYHDMGLIGNVLQPLYLGASCVLMSPMAFLQRPVRWLQAISRYRGTTSGGPNFAYELCRRKVTAEERQQLDLSCWQLAFNGAEPVRAATLRAFAETFAECGFRPEAFYPCYGLAEATLFVTGGEPWSSPRIGEFDSAALEANRAAAPETAARRHELVSCGFGWLGQQVRVVDPESRRPCPEGRVGEIWVAGPSVARGYWRQPEVSRASFGVGLAGQGEEGPFLRTGDLGFLSEGELFITGRIKDLLIVRGRNHYPQDLELTAEGAHELLRPGHGAAFAVEAADGERLVMVWEVERRGMTASPAELEAACAAVRQAVAEGHEVPVFEVVLLRPGALPKTTSGKVQRHACRRAYLDGSLPMVGRHALQPARAPQLSPERQLLVSANAFERPILLRVLLRQVAADVLHRPHTALSVSEPLTALGLDAAAAVELQQEVAKRLGLELPLEPLLAGAGVADLTAALAGQLEAA